MSMDTFERLYAVIDALIDAHPQGISAPELGEKFNVTRQTALNDINRLQQMERLKVPIYTPAENRYAIDPKTYLRPLKLTLPQAWLLYLPLRRMVRAQMERYTLVRNLLQRISSSFDAELSHSLLGDVAEAESEFDDVFTRLVEAWSNNYLVEIRYQAPNEPEKRHLIAPYWFEPAVWSDAVYVVAGMTQYDGSVTTVTLKLERIVSASVRPEHFNAPDYQEVLAYLSSTWGIWVDGEPVTVRLRFHHTQRQRLLETHWHPSQKIHDQADGSVIWEAQVAEPREMLSWIRGWGPDVEVLEPASIREQIAIDADRTARLYGMCGEEEEYF